MPLFPLSKSILIFANTLQVLSVVIVTLGWILLVVGFLLRSLTGLETLMTFQMCALTLHWVQNSLFIGLNSVKPLKYLSGLNVHFFET